MQKYRRILRRRATLSLIDWLVIVLFLTVWMVARNRVPTERPIPYIKAPGHILVQLAELPDHAEAETHTDQQWTLYGDGTLIFKADPSDTLWRARLAPGDIQHILDVIINQDTFFSSTQQRYGSITPESDDDELLLTVNANGQQKEVVLVNKPTNPVVSDLQTQRVFAIEQFLLAYHPVHAMFYAPNPNSDRESDDGHGCCLILFKPKM